MFCLWAEFCDFLVCVPFKYQKLDHFLLAERGNLSKSSVDNENQDLHCMSLFKMVASYGPYFFTTFGKSCPVM